MLLGSEPAEKDFDAGADGEDPADEDLDGDDPAVEDLDGEASTDDDADAEACIEDDAETAEVDDFDTIELLEEAGHETIADGGLSKAVISFGRTLVQSVRP